MGISYFTVNNHIKRSRKIAGAFNGEAIAKAHKQRLFWEIA